MDGLIAARVVHVLGVVLWIGGVALGDYGAAAPATRRMRVPEERIQLFESIEPGFARQARYTTLVTVRLH